MDLSSSLSESATRVAQSGFTFARPILLVESDPIYSASIRQCFSELGVRCPVVQVRDPGQALTHLRQHGEVLPCLILLNPDSEDGAGIELLRTLKSDDTLRGIPVVLLADMANEPRILASFNLGAAGYMVTTGEKGRLMEVIEAVLRYWSISRLPPLPR